MDHDAVSISLSPPLLKVPNTLPTSDSCVISETCLPASPYTLYVHTVCPLRISVDTLSISFDNMPYPYIVSHNMKNPWRVTGLSPCCSTCDGMCRNICPSITKMAGLVCCSWYALVSTNQKWFEEGQPVDQRQGPSLKVHQYQTME